MATAKHRRKAPDAANAKTLLLFCGIRFCTIGLQFLFVHSAVSGLYFGVLCGESRPVGFMASVRTETMRQHARPSTRIAERTLDTLLHCPTPWSSAGARSHE